LFAFILPAAFLNLWLLAFPHQILIIAGFWLFFGGVFYFAISWANAHFNGIRALFAARSPAPQIVPRVFLAALFLFPFGLLAGQQVLEFIRILSTGKVYDLSGWMSPADGAGPYVLMSLAIVLAACAATLLAARQPRLRQSLESMPDRYYILIIFLAALSMRFFFIYAFDTQPVSDFRLINSDALAVARGGRPQNMYVATHVVVTMLYGSLYKIFCRPLVVIKFFHALLYAFSGLFIYHAARDILGSRFWAGIAGTLLVSWPSLAFYSNVLSPEHLFIFLECALVYFAARFFTRQNTGAARAGWLEGIAEYIGIGLLIGLMGVFRPFGQLFLIAFLITLVVYARGWQALKKSAVKVSVLLLTVWLTGMLPAVIAGYYDTHFANVRPCNFLVGMSIDAAGQYNVNDVGLCRSIRLTSSNQGEFIRRVFDTVWARLQAGQNQILPFLGKKFEILWLNSNLIIFWAIRLAEGSPQAESALLLAQKVNLIDFTMMLVATLTCLIGTGIAFFRGLKPPVFFILLSFLGL
jgi:hypothetical protein